MHFIYDFFYLVCYIKGDYEKMKMKTKIISIFAIMLIIGSVFANTAVSTGDTSGSADWQEDSAVVGDTIHADFTWTNAKYHWVGECYACMYIYDPDNVIKASYIEEVSYTGSHTLQYTTDMAGSWLAKIKVYDGSDWLEYTDTLVVTTDNSAPNTPTTPSGPTSREVGQSGEYCTNATDPDGDQVQYRFDWDADGSHDYSGWTDLVDSGESSCKSHSWDAAGTYKVKAQAKDEHGETSGWSSGLAVIVNDPPNTPNTPSGPSEGEVDESLTYFTSATDPENDQVQYRFNWDDGETSGWTNLVNSGEEASKSHSWSSAGTYYVKAQAKDENGKKSGWSDTKKVTISSPTNNPPNKPSTPSGPVVREIKQSGTYSTNATDPDGDYVQYRFDWGYGETSGWTNLVPSGTTKSKSHSWNSAGTYYVKAQAKDEHGAKSEWSNNLTVTVTFPPNTPINPSPANGSEDVSVEGIKLSWDLGNPQGTVTYDVYINLAPEPHKLPKYNEEPLIDTQSPEVYCIPSNYYYWRVVATDENGAKTFGPVWAFYTLNLDECEEPDNSPPYKPPKPVLKYPFPYDVHVGDTLLLEFGATDPDGDNVNIYFFINEVESVEHRVLNVSSGKTGVMLYKWDSKPPGYYNISIVATDILNDEGVMSDPLILRIQPAENNLPPNNATIPSGISKGYEDKDYTFASFSTDPDGDKIFYKFDWGDDSDSGWIGPYDSGTPGIFSHEWDYEGIYDVKARVKDVNDDISPWSEARKVNIQEITTATIFDEDDFCGATHGDSFEFFAGTGRNAYANGSTGVFATSAYAGMIAGSAWSQAGQGCWFYVGREKQLTIDAEISYISGDSKVLPAITSLSKFIKIDGWYKPKKEFKSDIDGFGTIEDLKEFAAGLVTFGAYVAKNFKIWQLSANVEDLLDDCLIHPYDIYLGDKIMNMKAGGIMGKHAPLFYQETWVNVGGSGAYPFEEGAASTLISEASVVGGEIAGMPITSALAALALIVIVVYEGLTLWELLDHWQVDSMLKEFENSGKAQTINYKKSCTFDEGDHSVYAGLQTDATGALVCFGFAYAAGLVKSITIDGIAPPEEPTLDYPDDPKPRAGQPITFTIRAIDQNNDPVKFNISWGDGTKTITDFYNSGEEAEVKHKYSHAGTFTITLKTEDCDKMESEEVEYEITVKDTDDYEFSISPGVYTNPQSTPMLLTLKNILTSQSSQPIIQGIQQDSTKQSSPLNN
jgi:hypothetical protein